MVFLISCQLKLLANNRFYKYHMRYIQRNKLIVFTIASVIGLYFLWSPQYLLLTFIGYFLMLLGADIGLHRYYSHQSFICNYPGKIFLWFCIFISGISAPINYIMQHRYHHMYADTAKDIHPVTTNPLKAWFTVEWVDFSTINTDGIPNDKFNIFMQRHYFIVYLIFLSTVFFINVYFAFYFLVLASAITHNITSAVNVFCHQGKGYRNFNTNDNTANNTILNIITFGSGLHNNHHARPMAYSYKVKSFEFDLQGIIVKYFLKK